MSSASCASTDVKHHDTARRARGMPEIASANAGRGRKRLHAAREVPKSYGLPQRLRRIDPISQHARCNHPRQHGGDEQQDFRSRVARSAKAGPGQMPARPHPTPNSAAPPTSGRSICCRVGTWNLSSASGAATAKNPSVAERRNGKTAGHHKHQGRVPVACDIQEVENPRRIDHVGEGEPGTEYDPGQKRENQGHVRCPDHVTDDEHGRRAGGEEGHRGNDGTQRKPGQAANAVTAGTARPDDRPNADDETCDDRRRHGRRENSHRSSPSGRPP